MKFDELNTQGVDKMNPRSLSELNMQTDEATNLKNIE